MMDYHPPQAVSWQCRQDNGQLERLGQFIKLVSWKQLAKQSYSKNTIAFVGFACDEGVKRNHGREGAREGPDALRLALANYPMHDKAVSKTFIDVGNVIGIEGALEKSQATLGELVHDLMRKNIFPIVLGGGHETAWGHYQGIASNLNDPNFAIVNIDAHFDMRPVLSDGEGTSGTAFLQIAEERKKRGLPFHYYCFGIQKSSNTQSLFETAKEWDVHYLTCDECKDFPDQAEQLVKKIIKKHNKIYLTICLDAFSASVAPGVSAISPNGLLPSEVIPLLRRLAQSKKVIAADIVELSPPLDHHGMTAKLGAFCLVEFLYQLRLSNE